MPERPHWTTVVIIFASIVLALAIGRLPLLQAAGLVVVPLVMVITLIYPLFGLAVALVLGPFGALEGILFGNALLDSGQITLLFVIAAWIGSGLARRRLHIPSSTFNLPWLLFVLIATLSLLDARSINLGSVELLKWFEIALLVWLVLDVGTDPARRSISSQHPATIRHILAMLLFAGLIQALIGIWQFGLRGNGPEHFLVLGRFYRAYGTFEQPNPFGGYMNLTSMLALGTAAGMGVYWLKRRRGVSQPTSLEPLTWWLVFVIACAFAASLGLVLSWSRGAWLGYLAGFAILVLFSAQRFWRGFVLMLFAVLILGGLVSWGANAGISPAPAVVERLGGFREEFALGDVRGVDINDSNYSVIERLAHWQAAADMARDHLWTGVGFGNYAAAYPDYNLINFTDPLGHAHNYYLNLLAEVGLPGLLAYLLFWLVIAGQSIFLARRLPYPERGIAVGLLGAWVALAVHHLVDKLYVNNIYVHLGVMIGLLQLLAWSVNRIENFHGRKSDDSKPSAG